MSNFWQDNFKKNDDLRVAFVHHFFPDKVMGQKTTQLASSHWPVVVPAGPPTSGMDAQGLQEALIEVATVERGVALSIKAWN